MPAAARSAHSNEHISAHGRPATSPASTHVIAYSMCTVSHGPSMGPHDPTSRPFLLCILLY